MSVSSTLALLTGPPSTKSALSEHGPLKTCLVPHKLTLTPRSHIAPGGYIEHSEPTPRLVSDDSSVASGDIIHHCYELAIEATQKFGKDIMIAPFIRKRIEEAGFVNVVEKKYKWPLGEWPVDCKLKDIGRWNMQHWLEGIDAWTLRLLTQYCGVRQFPELSAISQFQTRESQERS